MTGEKRKELFDLDEILKEIKFGKFQKRIFLLIAFPIFLNGIYSSAYIFTASTLNYRCKIPQCEETSSNPTYLSQWLNFSTPFDSSNAPEKCKKFSPIAGINGSKNVCSFDGFDRSSTVECNDFVYEDDEITILNEFNLNCDNEYFLSLIGTINNIGQLFCYLLTGLLSDRYGRKIVLIVGTLGSGVFGILRVFSFNYVQFATFEFFDNLFGAAIYSTSFIIGLELVLPKHRTLFGTLLNCFYAIGEIYLGVVAMTFRNYKIVLLVTYIPAFFTVSYFFILPQSIRWLLQKGMNEDAKKILVKAAKINQTLMSEDFLLKLNEKVELKDDDESLSDIGTHKTSTRIFFQILKISYLWFAVIFVYYGLNINAVYLDLWSKYISFIVVCLIELPSYFITNILMEKIGRKKTLFLGMIGSGIFCILSEFIEGEMQKTICFIIGKCLITISFSCLYIFTIEVFPTKLRHRFFSICSIAGRVGSILTPLTPILAQQVSPRLPLIIFSSLSLSSALMLYSLPETLNRKLPDTVDEAFS